MLSQYYKNRKKKTLPVLKTDKDLEVEGLARLSIDLPSFQVTSEESDDGAADSTTQAPPAETGSTSRSTLVDNIQPYRLKIEDSSLINRHSVGFDVPGAVHTIMTPSKIWI
jgi:6-phosphofructo-2-kinase